MKGPVLQIIKWTGIGLLIRLLIMPFTMHGQDLAFINYFPMAFVEKGIWDPYGFISADFAHFPATYYGPVSFIIMSISNFITIKVFNSPSLVAMLELSSAMIGRAFSTIDYVRAFSGFNLYKNLFLMKSPYLVFDFAIGAILLKLAASGKQPLQAYKLWMLNAVVLQSVYAVGGAYLIPAFFVIVALYAALKKRPYFSIVLLSLGGATKLFPYFLIMPACLLLGNNWRKRASLLISGGLVTVLVYLPFYLSSGNSVLGFFISSGNVQYSGVARWLLPGLFLILYSLISLKAKEDSMKEEPARKLLYYFAIVMFLSYAAFPVRFRYFVFITPLLALIVPQYRKFGIFTASIIMALAFQWLPHRDLQLGLFAPINAEYFLGFPTIQEVIGRYVNIEIIYKITARALVLSFLAGAWWIWQIKLTREQARTTI